MADQFTNEPMLDMYIFETSQLIEQLEQSILNSEKESTFSQEAINEIFRIMHTIKGSSAMMMFNDVAALSHTLEDLFYFLREDKTHTVDSTGLSDFVFEGIDFIKVELEKIKNHDLPDGDASELILRLKKFLSMLKTGKQEADTTLIEGKSEKTKKEEKETTEEKTTVEEKEPQKFYISQDRTPAIIYKNSYRALIFFDEGCGMENIRAYTITHNLKDFTEDFYFIPQNIIEDESSAEIVQRDGFCLYVKSDKTYDQMNEFFQQTAYLKSLDLVQLESEEEYREKLDDLPEVVPDNTIKMPEILLDKSADKAEKGLDKAADKSGKSTNVQSIISVSVAKLDKLMDLVGEMVISEAMVTQNPDLQGLELDNFQKAAQQLNKITSELQDTVMSIRMVPLAPTFQKMNRIVRDMCKQLSKEVSLKILGEETEVDKNIIERISDPLMHLVRNSIDHGIESTEDRIEMGKEKAGTITLEAKNSGSDVLVIVRDDGKGLDKDKIIKKAIENDLLYRKPEDMKESEIFNLIFLPGFSTKDKVSEFSGRGVGMDVVCKNIEEIGGTLSVDSVAYQGTTITLKIPLTLAIIDGMNLKVGSSCYTLPTIAIKESLRPQRGDVITDPDGNEILMIRGTCYPIFRLHERFRVNTKITDFTEGIMILVEQDSKKICLFADELLGQQQVVVKSLPSYIQKIKKIKGLAGCTLLGDGSISLILDVNGLLNM